MKKLINLLYFMLLFASCIPVIAQVPAGYKGKPFEDEFHRKGKQVIPGKLELALYDMGGEGVAYHDSDLVNNGSGKLNYEQKCPASGNAAPSPYICHFRENEDVDISYTKDIVDFSHPNLYEPPAGQLYLGWQAKGEWTNYTVEVKFPGRYRITALYGRNDNGSSLWINNTWAADLKLPVNTGDWHSWNKAEVGYITFTYAGTTLLTLHYNTGSNLAYLEFDLAEKK
ncbi:MAG TPA: hypothetical protein VMT63_05180 [Bacteroidales bacterium]|nr:hypothetical protein [Bacteroidales bacterium]